MPSLSPTMESGTISSWNFKPGDSFIAGDSLAEVQTDKASIDFETTDDGVMGLIFAEEGVEINCGEPICVTLEEGEEFNAGDWDGYVPEGGSAEAAAAPPAAAAAAPTPPPPTPAPAPTSAPAPTPTPATPPPAAIEYAIPTIAIPQWAVVNAKSPLFNKMAEEQAEYVEKYGRTGFNPL